MLFINTIKNIDYLRIKKTVNYSIQVSNLQLLDLKQMTSSLRDCSAEHAYSAKQNKIISPQFSPRSYEVSRLSLKNKLLKTKQAIRQQLAPIREPNLQLSQSKSNFLYGDKQPVKLNSIGLNQTQYQTQHHKISPHQDLDVLQIGNNYYYSLHHIQYLLYKMLQSLNLDVKQISYFVGSKSLQQILGIVKGLVENIRKIDTDSKQKSGLQKQNIPPQGSYYFKTIRLQEQISQISKKYQEKKAESIRLAFQNRQITSKLSILQLKLDDQNTKIRDLLQLVKYDYQKSQAAKNVQGQNQKTSKKASKPNQKINSGKQDNFRDQYFGLEFEDQIVENIYGMKKQQKQGSYLRNENSQKGSKRVRIHPRGKLIKDQSRSSLQSYLNYDDKQFLPRHKEQSRLNKQMNAISNQIYSKNQCSKQLRTEQLAKKVLTLQKQNVALKLQIESYIQYMEQINRQYNEQVEKWSEKQQFYQRELARIKNL